MTLFLAGFSLAVMLGSLGEAGRRGLLLPAILALLGSCWMIYLATLWLLGRTLRDRTSESRSDSRSDERGDLFAEATLLLGPDEAARLVKALSPGQLRQFLERKRETGGE